MDKYHYTNCKFLSKRQRWAPCQPTRSSSATSQCPWSPRESTANTQWARLNPRITQHSYCYSIRNVAAVTCPSITRLVKSDRDVTSNLSRSPCSRHRSTGRRSSSSTTTSKLMNLRKMQMSRHNRAVGIYCLFLADAKIRLSKLRIYPAWKRKHSCKRWSRIINCIRSGSTWRTPSAWVN